MLRELERTRSTMTMAFSPPCSLFGDPILTCSYKMAGTYGTVSSYFLSLINYIATECNFQYQICAFEQRFQPVSLPVVHHDDRDVARVDGSSNELEHGLDDVGFVSTGREQLGFWVGRGRVEIGGMEGTDGGAKEEQWEVGGEPVL